MCQDLWTEVARATTNLLMLKNCRPIACILCPESGCCELPAVMQCLHQCVHHMSFLLVRVEMMLVNVQAQLLVFRHHSLVLPLAVANAMPNLAGKPDSGKEAEVGLRSDYGPLFPPFALLIVRSSHHSCWSGSWSGQFQGLHGPR